ncbi:MAG TPA: hypothetical protein VGM43_16550 [Bryobacteraceae bacterium]|jgi:hypothetical protein
MSDNILSVEDLDFEIGSIREAKNFSERTAIYKRIHSHDSAQRDLIAEQSDILRSFTDASYRPCGHQFDCVCHGDRARAILSALANSPEIPDGSKACPECGGNGLSTDQEPDAVMKCEICNGTGKPTEKGNE